MRVGLLRTSDRRSADVVSVSVLADPAAWNRRRCWEQNVEEGPPCMLQGTVTYMSVAPRDWTSMAQRRIVELIDDLNQTTIDYGGTLTSSLDGATYEIDLTKANQQRLRDALAPFIKAGRRVRPPVSRGSSVASPSAGERDAIRTWARQNGYSVSDRGRIAADIVAAYRAA